MTSSTTTLTTGQACLIRFGGTIDSSWIEFNGEL
jgi:hypothetical protein